MKPDASPHRHPSYRPDIDGLRAVAILSVLGFHAFPAWVPGGFVGVDIFFVISGFLISGILISDLHAGQFSLITFYARRIRRIFPALLIVLAAVLVFGYFILWPGEYTQLAKHAMGGSGFVVNYLLQQEAGYFAGKPLTKPLLHLWSLGVEEQFYICWPLMLWAGWRFKHHTGWVIAFVLVASFAGNIWLSSHKLIVDFYSPLSRFWELLAGGALAWAKERGHLTLPSRVLAESFSLIGLVFIVVADFAFRETMLFPGWLALMPVIGASLLILAGEKAFINRTLIANPLAVGIGLISYPLYLWHWPLLSYTEIISGEAPTRLLRISMVLIAFVLATLTYWCVERPIRKNALNKKGIGLLLLLMILIGAASATIYLKQGLPSRFSDIGDAPYALDNDVLIKTWEQEVRIPECQLQDPEATFQAPQCIEKTKPLLLLWGDSHAASLYPGLKKLQASHHFGIAQLTQAGCPPFFDVPNLTYRPNCNEINQRILKQIADLQPAVVLLNAAWSHDDYPMQNEDIVAHLVGGIKIIQEADPKAKIIVVGPVPRWTSSLPGIYRRSLTFNHAVPPERLSTYLDPSIAALDVLMSQRLTTEKITYISTQKILCNVSGCLTRLGDSPYGLTFIDEGHVSAPASEFLVDGFAPDLLSTLDLAQ